MVKREPTAILATTIIGLSNSTNSNYTVEGVQVVNTTITVKSPNYYSQQYNLLVALWSFLASPFVSITLFAMLVGVAMVYWYLRER